VHWKGTKSHPTPEENEKVAGDGKKSTAGKTQKKKQKMEKAVAARQNLNSFFG